MNATYRISIATLIAGISFGAVAAESADLAVTGTIRPSACNVALSSNGVVDYGTISASTLNESTSTQLPDVQSTLTISCDAPTRFAVGTVDNRAGTVASSALIGRQAAIVHQGLGAVNGTNIGAYQVNFGNTATADGGDAPTIYTQGGTTGTWTVASTLGRAVGLSSISGFRYFSWADADGATPYAYTTVVQPLTIQTGIIGRTSLPDMTSGIPLDGSLTISLYYL